MAEERFLSRRAVWLSRLADEVARGLTERIRSGTLAEGEPLPDTEALMADFVTSPTVVERALETLESNGLVRRDADGVFRVAPAARPDEGFAVPPLAEGSRADVVLVLELRIGVEAEAAALAAERRTEEQLAAIRAAQADFEAAIDAGTGAAQADFGFHLSIAEASGNHYVRDLTEYLGPLLIPRMRVQLSSAAEADDANLQSARAEHRRIVEAIAAADPEAAREAMRHHLARSLTAVRSRGR